MNAKMKRFLELVIGRKMTDGEFKDIMQIATDDIRTNRIEICKKKTRRTDVTDVAIRCAIVYAGSTN